MPRYYFDLEQDATVHRDDEGIEFANVASALIEMHRTLMEIGKDARMNDTPWEIIGTLRDDDRELWRGKLSLVRMVTEECLAQRPHSRSDMAASRF